MACAAKVRGDQKWCSVCHLIWDLSDPTPPECGRQAVGRDPKLSGEEVKALKLAVADWQPLRPRRGRRGGGFGRRGGPRIASDVAANLVAFNLCFLSAHRALRSTPYGKIWLDRNQ